MLLGFVSVPWNPYPYGKIELQVEPVEKGEEKGMGEDLQHKFPKKNLPFTVGD